MFLGTPAEELGSGKAIMIEEGAFDGLDAALLFHPSDRTHTRVVLLASEDVEVVFTGLESHASSDPWLGRNALDAMIEPVQRGRAVAPAAAAGGAGPRHHHRRWTRREHHPWPDRGGFMMRARDQADLRGASRRASGHGPSGRTGGRLRGRGDVLGTSTVMRNNEVLVRLWSANMTAAGIPDGEPVAELAGSSDMGNVSLVMPAIHPCIAICAEGIPGHSAAFRDAAASPRGDEVTLQAATLVAQTAWDLYRIHRWSRPHGGSIGASADPAEPHRCGAAGPLLRPRPAGRSGRP